MSRSDRYRGRKKAKHTKLRVMVIFLILLGIVGMGLIVLPNYLVYSRTDGRVYFDISFLNEWRGSPPPGSLDDPPVVETVLPMASQEPSPTPTPTSTPEPQSPARALFVPLSLQGETATVDALKAQLAANLADTVVLEMKAEDGRLAFSSETPEAIQAKVGSDEQKAIDLIRELKRSGATVIAYLSCFKDAKLPTVFQTVGVKHKNGLNWLEQKNTRWLNPYREEATDYLLGLVREVAALDVDEILLDNVSFPVKGNQAVISYGDRQDSSRFDPIEDFARRAAAEAHGAGVALSLFLWEETCVGGEHAVGGQRSAVLAPLCDKIYVKLPLPDETQDALLETMTGLNRLTPQAGRKCVPAWEIDGKTEAERLRGAKASAEGVGRAGWLLLSENGLVQLE